MNGVSKLVCSSVMDKLSFHKVFGFVVFLQLGLNLTLYYIREVKFLFFLWIALTYFTLGGYFSVFPTLSGKVFGIKVGPKIYPVIFCGFAFTTIIGSMVAKFLLSEIGYEKIFFLSSAFSAAALVLLFLFKEKTLWKVKPKYSGKYD